MKDNLIINQNYKFHSSNGYIIGKLKSVSDSEYILYRGEHKNSFLPKASISLIEEWISDDELTQIKIKSDNELKNYLSSNNWIFISVMGLILIALIYKFRFFNF